jgi:hypothetical protein
MVVVLVSSALVSRSHFALERFAPELGQPVAGEILRCASAFAPCASRAQPSMRVLNDAFRLMVIAHFIAPSEVPFFLGIDASCCGDESLVVIVPVLKKGRPASALLVDRSLYS